MDDNVKRLYELITFYFMTKNIKPDQELEAKKFVSEDIDEFFNEFATIFEIDMTDYNYYDYFFEDSIPFVYWVTKLLIFFNLVEEKKKIKISHLVLVIEKRKWFKP